MTRYGVRDLVLAELEGAAGRGGKRAEVRRRALRGAFALDLDPKGHELHRHDDLDDLWETTLQCHRAAHSPFEGYLEAPADVRRMSRHHGARIADPLAALKAALLDLLVDLAVARWALPHGMTVTSEDLKQHGYDPAEHPVDDEDY